MPDSFPAAGPVVGVDFGTTNSVVSVLGTDGAARTAVLDHGRLELPEGAVAGGFRSVLGFWSENGTLRHAAGPGAVARYLDDPFDTRLLLSLKSYLGQRSLGEARLFGRGMPPEALVGLFLRALLDAAGVSPGARVVAGRPVHFVGASADDALGEQRLRAGFAAAGFPAVRVALEPEAAGQRFAAGLRGAATVLVGDFGGGTSDFSVLRFDGGAARPLGHAGVGLAGDALDYRIIDRAVSPRLGKGGLYRVMGKALPVPPGWYASFARWHLMSTLRAPRILREIDEVAAAADDPTPLRHLRALIDDEAGYALYGAVSSAKAALSREGCAVLRFRHAALSIERPIERGEFEAWIAPELALLDEGIGRALADAGLPASAVDRVFLTGGTSLVPAVRALFERRFGAERVSGGGEFVSVAEGLALMGATGQPCR